MVDANKIREKHLDRIKKEWLITSDLFPEFLTEISYETKLQNESYITSITEDFQKQLKGYSHFPIKNKKWKQKTLNMLEDILLKETILGLHHSMDQTTIDAFQEELKDFFRHARKFAPELSFGDVGQALRNYIVYAMFKEIHGTRFGFNSAGFGYSMLYPFTDNYIDSKRFSSKEKAEYNQIIRDKIEGKAVHPKSLHQRKTCELLQMIEAEYPREKDSSIYTLLLMMLEAQEDSIRQDIIEKPMCAEERLDISLYKGGISVLIDRFFVNKEITEEDWIFYLGLGFFLQLADDLQDIKDDHIHGHQTMFTLDLHPQQQESLVNKMLHFIHQIMDAYHAENDNFKYFILSNCYQLIYSSLIGSKEFFSKEYQANMEKYLPVTAPYLENRKNNMVVNKDSKIQNRYLELLDDIISIKE